jgi:hypothetical protein
MNHHTWSDSPIHEQIRTMNDTPTPRTDKAREQANDMREKWLAQGQCCEHLGAELHEAIKQRDEARRLAEKYRNLSCDSQDKADETLLPWETTSPNEL